MLRALVLAALLTAPAFAQSDPALAPTADRFRADLTTVTAVLATAALVHDASGTFPSTPYALLGSAEAGRTGLRAASLSEISMSRDGDGVAVRYVPLPIAPYTRDDEVVTLDITRDDDGTYSGAYRITRRADPDDGGRTLPYDTAGRYRVDLASGTACVDVATVREQLATGTYTNTPGTLGPQPLTVRVVPLGGDTPVYYQEGSR
ncbi:MAG: hypothetical protein CMM84_01845 [Rhodothermaceae bacterium]|nr:hypothetical protein [Rhodothermaceae bacterium]MBC11931.1 hypothetical protein [Rhodothermaceae bacterium]